MDSVKREKITRFIDDNLMSDAVYGIMLEAFLKPQKGDVQVLAASRMAIDLLNDAWKDLKRFRNEKGEEKEKGSQIAL